MNGRVDFYARLIDILCSHFNEYNKDFNDHFETATDSNGRQGGQQNPHPPPL